MNFTATNSVTNYFLRKSWLSCWRWRSRFWISISLLPWNLLYQLTPL